MVFGTILRKVGVAFAKKAAKKGAKRGFFGGALQKALPILESKVVRAITEPATFFIKPLFKSKLKTTIALGAAGAALGSPTIRSKLKPSDVLLITPAAPLIIGKRAGEVLEKTRKGKVTLTEGLIAGGLAGAAVAGVAKIIKEKKEPKAPALVSPISTPAPTTTAPTKQIIESPLATKGGAVPTSKAKREPAKRKVFKQPPISINIINQNL